jgi:hypothetical protein
MMSYTMSLAAYLRDVRVMIHALRSSPIVLAAGAAMCLAVSAASQGAPEAELWTEPGDRNVAAGPVLAPHKPQKDGRYEVLSLDAAGFSITYDVKDARGVEWSVKIGPEAQTEVVASRILWMLGYHQPSSYFVERWTAVEDGEPHLRGGARFRPKEMAIDGKGPWQWRDNPFIGTKPFNGLLVLLMLLNSTDLKDDNNELYELASPREGARRWFVVKDLGASLGETGRMEPRRGYIDGFEREPFIREVSDGRVRFAFRGRHQDLLRDIGVDDVHWMCARVLKVSDRQWRQAFAAGGYDEDTTRRYIARIREKATEGMALR